jgi:hypothetical protein
MMQLKRKEIKRQHRDQLQGNRQIAMHMRSVIALTSQVALLIALSHNLHAIKPHTRWPKKVSSPHFSESLTKKKLPNQYLKGKKKEFQF